MLRVFDLSKKKVGVFDGYDAFLSFITSLENQKLLEGGPCVGKDYWSFAEYSPEKLKHVCAWIKPGYLTTVQTKALEQKLGLLEICRGDPAMVWEVPVTSELDVEEIRKKFCLDYCQTRQWRLIETQNHKPSLRTFTGEERNVVLPFTRKSRLSQTNLDNARGRRLKAELDCCIDRLRQKPVAEKFTSMQGPIKKIQEPTAREEEVNTRHASQGNSLAGHKSLAMQKEKLGTKKYFMGALIGVGFGVLSSALGLETGKSDPSNGNGQLPALIKVPKFSDGGLGIDSWVWQPDFPHINSEKLVKKTDNLSMFQQLGESLINKGLLRAVSEALNKFLNEARQEHSMSPWRDAGYVSEFVPRILWKQIGKNPTHVRVDWNKIMRLINSSIHAKPDEDANACLLRAEEQMKLLLVSFEAAYDLRVVWDDFDKPSRDVTAAFSEFVHLVQEVKKLSIEPDMLLDPETYQRVTQFFKNKNAAERGA